MMLLSILSIKVLIFPYSFCSCSSISLLLFASWYNDVKPQLWWCLSTSLGKHVKDERLPVKVETPLVGLRWICRYIHWHCSSSTYTYSLFVYIVWSLNLILDLWQMSDIRERNQSISFRKFEQHRLLMRKLIYNLFQ